MEEIIEVETPAIPEIACTMVDLDGVTVTLRRRSGDEQITAATRDEMLVLVPVEVMEKLDAMGVFQ